jgi:uncharacterized integral membrane protein (TIGR00697 family)
MARKKQGVLSTSDFFHLSCFCSGMLFSISVPSFAPSEWYSTTYYPAYSTIFSLSLTFTIASLIAYLVSNHIDVSIYQALKKLNPGKMIWLRNNMSTLIGQLVDAVLWYFIAFSAQIVSGNIPMHSMIFKMILPYWLARLLLGALQTPLCYLGNWWLRGKRQNSNNKKISTKNRNNKNSSNRNRNNIKNK